VKLIWSRLAIDRAVEAARYIGEDKPAAADRWLDGLFKTVDRLEAFPNSGHGIPELPNSKYRQLTYRSHRIIFSVGPNVVHILTVRRFKQRLDVSELESPEVP